MDKPYPTARTGTEARVLEICRELHRTAVRLHDLAALLEEALAGDPPRPADPDHYPPPR